MTLCCALWAAFLAAGRRQRARSRARDRRHRHPAAAGVPSRGCPARAKGSCCPFESHGRPAPALEPAAAGPERALRKEVTALADRLKALTAEEERAHAATLARFDDTDDDEDDGAVPPPPPPPPAPPAPPPPLVESTAAAADVACPRRARAVCADLRRLLGAEAAAQPRGGAEPAASWPPCTTRAPRALLIRPRGGDGRARVGAQAAAAAAARGLLLEKGAARADQHVSAGRGPRRRPLRRQLLQRNPDDDDTRRRRT